jgi:exonuclease SbcC
LTHLRNLRSEIEGTLEHILAYENETAPLRSLSAMFNADNRLRLDLETYAIGAMFDHVLAAANLRLGPMTNGRYSLARENDGSDGRSRHGLGISVFDLYTGKGRAPSTLSGGETFIAALALGLSDVVESVNGKVHLDTIFIDDASATSTRKVARGRWIRSYGS